MARNARVPVSKPSVGATRLAEVIYLAVMNEELPDVEVERMAEIVDAEVYLLVAAMQDLIHNCWSRSDAAASKAKAEAELAAWFGDKRRYKEMADHDC